MLRTAGTLLSGLSILPVIVATIGCVAGPAIALAGAQSGHRHFRAPHITAHKTHVMPVRSGHGERRHMTTHHSRLNGFSRHGGYFGNASAFLESDHYGPGNQPVILNQPTQASPGPISFADLPASTGIRSAPPSPPLFMKVSGRQVMADDGEKYLWRAGPRIIDLDSPVRRRQARQGQPRQDHVDITSLGTPKIIVIRP